MRRSVLAITAGYVALAVVSAVVFTGAYFVVGIDAAFVGASFHISPLMAACGIAAGFVGGLAGGLVCRRIASHADAGRVLAAVALVLTLLSGVPMLRREPPQDRRRPDIERLAAMTRAFHPRWFTLVFPLGQAIGVWLITTYVCRTKIMIATAAR